MNTYKCVWSILFLLGTIGIVGCSHKQEVFVLTEESTTETLAEELSEEDTTTGKLETTTEQEVQEQSIFVHVCGAVKHPGVYELALGSRAVEAIQAAGGFTEEASREYINLATLLQDGVKVMVPTVTEMSGISGQVENSVEGGIIMPQSLSGESIGEVGKININTADEAELCNITGIGASRAKSIIAYREKNGEFHSIEDIMKVAGIKEGSFAKMKDEITVR